MDLQLVLELANAADPDRVAVSDPSGRRLTTGQLHELAIAAASTFRSTGASGVAYCGANEVALPVALFGATTAGMPFVPLNYRLADPQLAQIVAGHDFVTVASDRQAARLANLRVAPSLDPRELLEPVAGDNVVAQTVDPDDVALLLYTSGTTAAPKAAVLRHRHLVAYVLGTVELGASEATEAVLVSVPPYHIAGVMNLLTNLYSGRQIVYLDAFDPRQWLRLVQTESVTHAMVVPTMLARIVAALDNEPANTPSLRSLSYGGAKMPGPVIERALQLFPDVAFANAYGLTETSSTISVLGPEEHRAAIGRADPQVRARLHSVGLPVPGLAIEIRDERGQTCPPFTVGEIFVRGEQIAGEYLGADKPDGDWFATRDLGHLDDAGYLFIEGRADDTIIRGGENIAPAEVEDVLLRHPAVADCAVVGIDDDEWGHRIGAAVVLSPGVDVGIDELRAHALTHLRGSKTPDVIEIHDALPYTDTGKLIRRAVGERLKSSAGQ